MPFLSDAVAMGPRYLHTFNPAVGPSLGFVGYSASYLLIMGLVILVKAFGRFPSQSVSTYLIPVAFAGAFIDAIGGGGWEPIVATTLIVRAFERQWVA